MNALQLVRIGLLTGGALAAAGGLLHLACIAGGPKWYAFFQAPAPIVRSAEQGTWLAPLSTVAIAGAMFLAAAYAVSLAGLGPRLPLARLAVATVAALCALRVLGTVLLLARRPDLYSTFELMAGLIFLAVAVTYAWAAALPPGWRPAA
ncbi:MAG TPA: hypothetical protein VIT92_04790 [Burkholderiaceae bacterium]